MGGADRIRGNAFQEAAGHCQWAKRLRIPETLTITMHHGASALPCPWKQDNKTDMATQE